MQKYKATRAFRLFRQVEVGDILELNDLEYQRFAEALEPVGIQPSSIVSMPDKKYKKGRTKNA